MSVEVAVTADAHCTYLEWDSDFFGCRIARATVDHLDRDGMECIISWCRAHMIDCLYFLAAGTDPGTVRLAEDNHFRLVDVRITLECNLKDEPVFGISSSRVGKVRLCTTGDVSALRAIARASHHDSRFYYDPNLSRTQANALYEVWIEKSCNGYADAVLVADIDGTPVGYISCHLEQGPIGKIGLVGVDQAWAGMGWGHRMVEQALHWFSQQGAERVLVTTQGRNCQAQRLYQRCGFLTRSLELWYHKWFPQEGNAEGAGFQRISR